MKVLVADDHAVTRRGLRELVIEAFDDVEVVEAATTDEIFEAVGVHACALFLLDVRMPGVGIVEVIRRLCASHPAVPIVVVTGHTEIEYAVETMNAGAKAFVYKHQDAEVLVQAMRTAAAGETFLAPETAMTIATSAVKTKSQPPHTLLSGREWEVFVRIAKGAAVKEIAAELHISDKTVATYVSRIRQKTGLSTAVDVARYALVNKLVD